jgi:Pregnancy-associated plasma protein-A/GEVED domain
VKLTVRVTSPSTFADAQTLPMTRTLTLSTLLAIALSAINAQERCTAHTITQRWLEQHGQATALAPTIHHHDGARKAGGTATIPVVVHVVWNSAAENVPDALILDMITTLNEDYQAQNSDYDDVRASFLDDRGNPNIEFCLATIDPEGDPTTGITRTQTGETWFDPDTETDDMKSAPDGIAGWDPYSYLNIWICDISSGATGGFVTAGYAYLPIGGVVGSDIDGLVLDYDYGIGGGSRTATHEVGHYLGLLHPWADGGCGSDDGMDDTPVTDEATFSCANSNLMNCGVLTQYENFMDYANCEVMFTNDQSAYMNALLLDERAGLLVNNACGIVTTGPCIPSSASGTSDGDFIDGVELGSISNIGSGGAAGDAYTDYSAQFSTTLQRTEEYTITITSGDYTPDFFAAWIDYDQDDIYESSEKLGEFSNGFGGQSWDFGFIVPANAILGNTVMRVRGVYLNTGEPDPVDPCYDYSFGETEDYGITITNSGSSGPCIPTSLAGTDDGDFVDGVQLGTIDNTGTATTGQTYVDYTSQSTDLTRGDAYTITVTSGDYEQDILGAWIDFNANDQFETEELLGEALTTGAFESVDFLFTVPIDAALGATVLRVRCVYPNDGEPQSADPCFNYTWGETEDYTVNVETNTGVTASEATTIMAYPNPADDGLLVTTTNGATGTSEVLDPLGRVLVRDLHQNAPWTVDVSGLANGQYLLRCIVGGEVITMAFSVEHAR